MTAIARNHTIGAVCAILSALGFAGKAVFIRVIYSKTSIDAVTLLALRMLFSLPFFAWFAWRSGRALHLPTLSRLDRLWLLWLGFLGYYFSSFLDFWGLEYITAALERIILFTYPTWVLLLSAAFLGRAIQGRDVLALLLSTAGIVVTFLNDLRGTISSAHLWKGASLVLSASVLYSVYLIHSSGVVARVGSIRFTAWVVMVGTVFVVVQFLLTRPVRLLCQPPEIYWLSLALAALSTAAPIYFLVEALRRVSPSTVAIASSVGPIITIFLGVLFLDERATLMQLSGALLVLAGVGLITHPPTSAQEVEGAV